METLVSCDESTQCVKWKIKKCILALMVMFHHITVDMVEDMCE